MLLYVVVILLVRSFLMEFDGVPLITTPGNHDVGRYFSAKENQVPFYLKYFPHRVEDAGQVHHQSFHSHRAGDDFLLLAIDSDLVATLEEQYPFIETTLEEYKNTTNVFAAYHYAAYPSKPSHVWMKGEQTL